MSSAIALPGFMSARSAGEAVAACNTMSALAGDVVVDTGRLKFIDPFGLALLGATFHEIHARGQAVRVVGLNNQLANYLDRMDAFAGVELVGYTAPANHRHARGDALVELTRLDNKRGVDEAAHRLAHAVVGKIPGIDPNELPDEMTGFTTAWRLEEPIQYALSELLENAMTHARKHGFQNSSVWVACQHYPSSGMIRMGIVDNGCGFLASLRNHPSLHRQQHLDAILMALQPRISCNRDLRTDMESINQGVGLTTTCRIAESAGGGLTIVSGDAMHHTLGRSGLLGDGVYWQGVAIAIEFRRARLPDVNVRNLLPPIDAQPAVNLRFE
jgi:anti-anti-sigma regulatory factor